MSYCNTTLILAALTRPFPSLPARRSEHAAPVHGQGTAPSSVSAVGNFGRGRLRVITDILFVEQVFDTHAHAPSAGVEGGSRIDQGVAALSGPCERAPSALSIGAPRVAAVLPSVWA